MRCWATSPLATTSSTRPPPGPGSSSPRCWSCRSTSMWVTIYEDDDEAFDIWTKEVGVAPTASSAWARRTTSGSIGSGPCGPCSEIYFDRGEEYGCGKPDLRRRLRLRPVCGVLEPGLHPVRRRRQGQLCRRWSIPTSTPAWAWSAWPASCRGWTTSLRSTPCRIS